MRPTLFRLTLGEHTFPVSSYTFFGVLAAVYLLGALFWLVMKNRPLLLRQLTKPQLLSLALGSMATFFVGSRLLYGLLYYPRVQVNPPLLWSFQLQNFSLHGGLLLVLALWALVARRKKSDPLHPH